MKEEIYNGFKIRFDVKTEVWYTCVDENGKPYQYDSDEKRVWDSSLKKLKEKLDLMCKSKFERMKVFVRAGHYRLGGGRDEEYLPEYTEATLTSVAPNGNAYIVKKGEKHSEKYHLGGFRNNSIIQDTPENRKIIAAFEKQGEIGWNADREQARLKENLEMVDGEKLFKSIYKKDI